jgi:hypothetical protein
MSDINWESQEISLSFRRPKRKYIDKFIFTKLDGKDKWKCLLRVARIRFPSFDYNNPQMTRSYLPDTGQIWVYRKFSSLENAKRYAEKLVKEIEDPDSEINKAVKGKKDGSVKMINSGGDLL